MRSNMKTCITKANTYAFFRPQGLQAVWCHLSKGERRYARHLVESYGYRADIAIQQAYIFGFDPYPFNYRKDRMETETMTREQFGL